VEAAVKAATYIPFAIRRHGETASTMPRHSEVPVAIEWNLDGAEHVVGVNCAFDVFGEAWGGQIVDFPSHLEAAWATLATFELRRAGFEPTRIFPAPTETDPGHLGFFGDGPPPFWLRALSTL
jgi:hypothetical protein